MFISHFLFSQLSFDNTLCNVELFRHTFYNLYFINHYIENLSLFYSCVLGHSLYWTDSVHFHMCLTNSKSSLHEIQTQAQVSLSFSVRIPTSEFSIEPIACDWSVWNPSQHGVSDIGSLNLCTVIHSVDTFQLPHNENALHVEIGSLAVPWLCALLIDIKEAQEDTWWMCGESLPAEGVQFVSIAACCWSS